MRDLPEDTNCIGLMLEQIRDQNKTVLEAVCDMQKEQKEVGKIAGIEENVKELKQDMKVVKAAVTDLSRQVAKHERIMAHHAHNGPERRG